MTHLTLTPLPPESIEVLESPRHSARRLVIVAVGGVVLFIITYALAWLQAYQLSMAYFQDADRSFEEGRYLDALVGYSVYDRPARRYIYYGGYIQIQRIWESEYARPVFPDLSKAQARIDVIINEYITIENAEEFIQENSGQSNPYLGLIYLRLGELYEADGRIQEAQDIYKSFEELFKDQTELIKRAKAHLERLQKDAR
ncbi:MAG: hypothetical protein IAE83_15530 [Anaerolinea sp.]|nr:hypothetical protein [Anaerolinea sp.]